LENIMLAFSLDDSSRYEGYVDGHIAGRAEGHAIGHAAGLAEGRAEGRAEGLVEGRAEGRAEGAKVKAIETARKMKAKGLDFEIIADCTGLTPDDIAAID
jgi:predicted transposase/invertase (TIGR01784 family)